MSAVNHLCEAKICFQSAIVHPSNKKMGKMSADIIRLKTSWCERTCGRTVAWRYYLGDITHSFHNENVFYMDILYILKV